MTLLIIVLIVVAVAISFLPKLISRPDRSGSYRKAQFMSDAELRFYKALSEAVGTKYKIFAKPRLNDLVYAVNQDRAAWQSQSNQLRMKHVDFILCDPISIRPVCAVELDDSSHARSDRQARDVFVDDALKSAGINIVHFVARGSYSVAEISKELSKVLLNFRPEPILSAPIPPVTARVSTEPAPASKSRAVLIQTNPPDLHKDLKYMPPEIRNEFNKNKNSL